MSKFWLALLASPVWLWAQVSVTTHHNDLNRTGQNVAETILNTTNVTVGSFGKLFSRTVDGQIYAQPLYVPNILIPGQGVHNVVYVCTENDSVYAFDADGAAAATPLWQVNLGPAILSTVIDVTRNLQPQIGITSTPVIDLSSNTLYVVAETYENSQAIFRLHALDIATGAEKFNGPVEIQGSVQGSSSDSVGGSLAFNAIMHWQRAGLLLWGGSVYIAFGSHEDQAPYHGWVFAYNATTLTQSVIYCVSPNGTEGGIWQGGVGLALDTLTGFLYLETGNGTMDANTRQGDYGDSILKLDTSNHLAVVDYFSPSNQASLSSVDADLGSGGVLLIPGTTLGVGEGKDGTVYLFNRNNLGQYNTTLDQVVQEWQATYSYILTGDAGFFGGPVFYNSQLYVWGRRDTLKEYALTGSTFNTTPVEGTTTIPDGYSNEPSMSISANGNTAGSGILWAAYSTNGDSPNGGASPGILMALDASNVTKELWDSNQNQTQDYSGSWAKWCPPTIANGKVYLATFDNILNVYGLLSVSSGGSLLGSGTSSAAPVNLTAEGSTDWEHWGTGGLNRKVGVTPQLGTYATVGAGGVSSYSNDLRPMSWTDGTPTLIGSNETDGLFANGTGQGFAFQAPADTATRTLVVHVGGWDSGGTLTAHLSDRSAADFTDVTAAVSGQFNRNYTLTYHAGSAGQTLTITWEMNSGAGNVTLNAVALSTATDNVAPSAGTPQTAAVHTAFATALQATVTDSGGNPVSGAMVIFTAPSNGASGTFAGGSATANISTGGNGVAMAPAFTANGQTGNYTVSATATGAEGVASFSLTNTAAAGSGVLSGSGTSSAAAVNLTTEGSLDWEHWGTGGLNRKVGVTPQLGTYATVGAGGVITYSNDPRPMSWTDGTPTLSGSNETDGLFASGTGQGFAFQATADTATRTLVVHVGGWDSGGTLTAHLSDGSAADFTDVTAAVSGQFNRNYTLTYHAASAGQTLRVSWVMSSGGGNVTLNAAALSAAVANVAASAGTPQSVTINTVFATALQATVTAGGTPVSGVTVTFSAPGSGASGTFTGSVTATATTNSMGVATAPTLTANATAGSYTVTATALAAATAANFSLTNTAVVSSGALSGSGTSSAGAVNLTTEGSLDWEHWGDGVTNHKVGVTPQLSGYTPVGSAKVLTYGNDLRPINWTDGTPTASSAGNTNGAYIQGTGEGFTFQAPAGMTSQTLIVHVGGWNSGGTLTAHLSDGSAPDFTDLTTAVSGQYDRNYTLTYRAASAGQRLTITWVMSSGVGNVTLNAAALSGPGSSPSGALSGSGTSSAGAVNLTTEGSLDWEHWGDGVTNHKVGVTPQLSAYTLVGSAKVLTYGNDPRPVNWTDGTPTASSAGNTNGAYIQGTGEGFTFQAPAGTTSQTLLVHVGGWNSGGTLTAHLSDGSAADFTDVTAALSGQYDRNYTLTYQAASTGQTLTITWVMSSGIGNVTLNAAALQ